MQRDNNLTYEPTEVYVGNGAKQVLYNIFWQHWIRAMRLSCLLRIGSAIQNRLKWSAVNR